LEGRSATPRHCRRPQQRPLQSYADAGAARRVRCQNRDLARARARGEGEGDEDRDNLLDEIGAGEVTGDWISAGRLSAETCSRPRYATRS
jgi:hypothetical protein